MKDNIFIKRPVMAISIAIVIVFVGLIIGGKTKRVIYDQTRTCLKLA